jgi:hypothetical protein
VLLVAAMTQAGYAGNQRYLVLPAAIACALGGAGLVRAGRAAASAGRLRGAVAAAAAGAFVIAVLTPFAVPRAQSVADHLDRAGEEARVNADLDAAVERVGGRARVLRCGTPYTGPYEVPAVAWHLSLHTAQVGLEPRPPGVVFRKRAALSRFGLPRRGDGFRRAVRVGGVDVLAACRAGRPLRVRGPGTAHTPAAETRLAFSDRSGRFTTLPAAWSR